MSQHEHIVLRHEHIIIQKPEANVPWHASPIIANKGLCAAAWCTLFYGIDMLSSNIRAVLNM